METKRGEGDAVALEVPVGDGKGGYCLEDADEAVGLENQAPVDEAVDFGLARAAEEDVSIGSFVCQDGGGGAVGEATEWVVSVVLAQFKEEGSHQIIIMRNDERTCGSPKITFVKTGQNSENEPAGRRYAIVFFRLSKTTRPY